MTLRGKIVLLVLVLTVAILGGLWFFLAGSVGGWSTDALEHDLSERAEAVGAAVEVKRGGRLEIEEEDLPGADDPARPWRILGPGGFTWASNRFPWPPASPRPAPGVSLLTDAEGRVWHVVTRAVTVSSKHRERGSADLLVQVAGEEAPFVALGQHFRRGLLGALLAALVMGGGGAALLAHLALRPLRRFAAEVDAIGAHSLDRRIGTSGLDPELSHLGGAFNDLLARLEEAMQRQRRLVSRASHSLRTPAATILTRAEVALRRERAPQEYREALSEIAGAARESAGLIAHLLTLSRLDERQRALDLTELPVAEVAGEVARLLAPRSAEAEVSLAVEVPPELRVRAERAALRELLEALCDNALCYTPRGGHAGIRAAAAPGGAVELTVWDDGPGIPAEERSQVLERFFRGSASAGKPGSGLGLPIAQAIAEAHRAALTLGDRPGGGLEVRVRFPATASA
ncbi:MAG: HAMP domain-containing histidine kinase [Deltaproteobacteria bacterium]|nr:HAMP domain-containing histidine kinase [Deltaproteobacteria bacterium]